MKKIICLQIFLLVLFSCEQKSKTQTVLKNDTKDVVEVLYFHGKKRCITCNAIEKLAKEVVMNDFESEVKNGEVIFKSIDISDPKNESLVNRYEVTWSSLFINAWDNGVEKENNMTLFSFSKAKSSPDEFKVEIKKTIRESIKN